MTPKFINLMSAVALVAIALLATGCDDQVDAPKGAADNANKQVAETDPPAPAAKGKFADYQSLVSQTHKASLEAREAELRRTIAEDKHWIKGNWGNTLWCLSALYLNERVDDANARLLAPAKAYAEAMEAAAAETDFRPEKQSGLSPWGYFALTDYLRILHLFGTDSSHHPGRLEPETEAAMKEALWWLVKDKSKVADASLDKLLVHHGTENHDLTLRPNYYLAAALFKDDPAYKDRKYDDGHTAADHYEAYNRYYLEWPQQRVKIGMWFEMGSDTYQKYSWPALFNLHELSPDPLVRKRFGMLLDVGFVEEAQVSILGRRGGGRSRAGYGKNNFESYKNLLYATNDAPAQSTHSKVIETSTYQLPAAAILLRKMAFPADKPFLITNRVPGEMATAVRTRDKDDTHNAYVADSALINYAYRTPHYLLGSTLQNPALHMPRADGAGVTLKYSGISRQNRWSGMLFHDPEARHPQPGAINHRADNEMCAIYPVIEKTRGGRPQHPFWSFQNENVLFMQRITPQDNGMGSYSTGKISINFHGRGLKKVEEAGWIFAGNGKAFVGVKFLDGGYEWDEAGELASPTDFTAQSTTRYLMHAGDLGSYESFEAFRKAVLAGTLTVEADRVVYQPSATGAQLEVFRYDVATYERFQLPRVDGKPVDLRPDFTFRSPYLNSDFNDTTVTVTVGPIKQVYDFDKAEVR